jgi:putative transposase
MTELCREFGISRKTGYKSLTATLTATRSMASPPSAIARARSWATRQPADRPGRQPDRQPQAQQTTWGARKIRELLLRRLPGHVRLPAKSTIHAVLDRHGLVKRMSKRRARATGTPLSKAFGRNDLWCADFKGEFTLGNGRYCYPLTVTEASRFPSCAKPRDIARGRRRYRLRTALCRWRWRSCNGGEIFGEPPSVVTRAERKYNLREQLEHGSSHQA